MQRVIREVAIYAILLVALAFFMHPDLLSQPSERFSILQNRGNYIHPFLYTFIVFIILFIIRFFVKKTLKLFRNIRKS
jgi:hypothetical protein